MEGDPIPFQTFSIGLGDGQIEGEIRTVVASMTGTPPHRLATFAMSDPLPLRGSFEKHIDIGAPRAGMSGVLRRGILVQLMRDVRTSEQMELVCRAVLRRYSLVAGQGRRPARPTKHRAYLAIKRAQIAARVPDDLRYVGRAFWSESLPEISAVPDSLEEEPWGGESWTRFTGTWRTVTLKRMTPLHLLLQPPDQRL